MEQKPRSDSACLGDQAAADDALLEVIQNNIQRLPGNDNAPFVRQEPAKQGVIASIVYGAAFACLMVAGVVLMAVFKLVPSSKDDHYQAFE